MITFWYYIVHVRKLFNVIEHKFPIHGHTFLLCDRDFGVIEKKKRKTPAVYTPKGWMQLVRESRPCNPFKVVEMAQNDFIDIGNMKEKLTFRSVKTGGSKVKLQMAVRIKLFHNTGRCSLHTLTIQGRPGRR